jgi:hypothetical protein
MEALNRSKQELLGKRILCEHDWLERGCNQEVHPEPRRIGQDRSRHVRRAPYRGDANHRLNRWS